MRLSRYVAAALTASAAALACSSAFGQTIKIGFISSYSGPAAAQGDQLDKGAKLYMKLNADKLPPGVKVELVVRDDTGPNPDVAKRIAQELIVRDKVQFLTGVVWTPNAAAIAPMTAEAKVPFISMNAAGSNIVNMSPYFARISFTIGQSAYPLGEWAAKKYKRAYIAVSDFAPGHEAEQMFTEAFKAGGGQIVGSVRIPLANPDFVPYMQRVKDAKPDVLFAFNPAGKQATAMMKAYGDLGLRSAGVRYIGTGDTFINRDPESGYVNMGTYRMQVHERNLLGINDLAADMEKLRALFDLFEHKTRLLQLLDISGRAHGVQIYIGGESELVPLDELSMVVAPYEVDGRVVGTLGVIGPTRMAYERVIPIVDITAKLLSSALSRDE